MGPRSKKSESRQPLCGFRELQLQGIPRRPVMNPFRPSPDEMAFPISKCRCHQFCLLNPLLNRRQPSKRVADLCLDLLLALGHLLDLQVCFPWVSMDSFFLVEFWEVVLGGRDCLSFSAFSASLRARVYRCLEHRTLNLIRELFLFFLIRAAVKIKASLDHQSCPTLSVFVNCSRNIQEASFRRQISMNCFGHCQPDF